jgi:hypothetical protein
MDLSWKQSFLIKAFSQMATIAWTPLNEEQCSARSIYSMVMHSEKLHLQHEIAQVKLLRGNCGVKGERE